MEKLFVKKAEKKHCHLHKLILHSLHTSQYWSQVILTSDLVRSGGLPDTLFNIQALMYEKH